MRHGAVHTAGASPPGVLPIRPRGGATLPARDGPLCRHATATAAATGCGIIRRQGEGLRHATPPPTFTAAAVPGSRPPQCKQSLSVPQSRESASPPLRDSGRRRWRQSVNRRSTSASPRPRAGLGPNVGRPVNGGGWRTPRRRLAPTLNAATPAAATPAPPPRDAFRADPCARGEGGSAPQPCGSHLCRPRQLATSPAAATSDPPPCANDKGGSAPQPCDSHLCRPHQLATTPAAATSAPPPRDAFRLDPCPGDGEGPGHGLVAATASSKPAAAPP